MGLREKPATIKGPAEWFTSDVWIDPIVQPEGGSPLNVTHVRFAPGARTAWHSHAADQTLYVTDGRGLVCSRGETPVELRPGDIHVTAAGDEHWHGAAPGHFMAHLSITAGPVNWGEHVTDAEYGAAG